MHVNLCGGNFLKNEVYDQNFKVNAYIFWGGLL